MRNRKLKHNNVSITVRFPDYFKEFSCIGGSCEDTCCGCWNIAADKVSIIKYRKVTGDFGKRLSGALDGKTGSFVQKEGRCPFLNGEKLCEIYLHLGEGSMCKTCRTYPRHVEIYGPLHEVSLSLSCPEAARMILRGSRTDGFYVRKRVRGSGAEELDGRFLKELLVMRDGMFSMMRRRSVPIEVRMAMVLAFSHDAEKRVGDTAAVEDLVARYTKEDAAKQFERQMSSFGNRMEERRDLMCAYLEFCGGMEPVVKEWDSQMEHDAKTLYHPDVAPEVYAGWQQDMEREYEAYALDTEHLMNYFIYSYVLGALYDGAVYAKVKMAVFCCLVIREQEISVWAERGAVTREDAVRIAYRFSRELEHSDYNLERLETFVAKHRAVGLKQLLVCI